MRDESFTKTFLSDIALVANNLNTDRIEFLASRLNELRRVHGRLFIMGAGGSLASASHSVNDFRKICGIQAFNPFDNVPEITALINDTGWDNAIVNWLKCSELNYNDAILVYSVGGGDREKNVSVCLANAVDYANEMGADVYSVVGRSGGYVGDNSDITILIPTIDDSLITPIVEAFHTVILHLLVSHPELKKNQTTWESISDKEKENK
jgi:D-sedoheptulose 7-phosphate isomerase